VAGPNQPSTPRAAHAVVQVNGTGRYSYDADGNMVVRNQGYGYEQRPGGQALQPGGPTAGGARAGRAGPALPGSAWQHTVHVSDPAGNYLGSRGYYAFGATRRSEGAMPTDRRFTGQVEDHTGLYYYNSRYYDPHLGQFISPDTLVPEPTNLLSYNRYLYAKGNPLKFSDPSGHYSVGELQQHFGVNSFEELTALFGEGGQYDGNSGWYDILRAAQDGDQITAVLPDAVTSISGNFMRNADGRIQIDMGGGQIVAENVFAEFGGHQTGMTYNGHPAEYGAYYL
jgi:RHS repeat-associated protein